MGLSKFLRRRLVLRRIDYRDEPLSYYVGRLLAGEPYSFSRFGDGEWNAILGRPGRNVDGHAYFPKLGDRLAAALTNPGDYLYGLMDRAMAVDGPAIAGFLANHRVRVPWYASDVFHMANQQGTLLPLIDALRRRPVVPVSSAHLRALDGRVFDLDGFIEVPATDCWLEYDRIRDDILAHAGRGGGRVYAFSASMVSNVLIDELHPVLGADNWLIDFGSLWDIYVGQVSRGGFDRSRIAALIESNLGHP